VLVLYFIFTIFTGALECNRARSGVAVGHPIGMTDLQSDFMAFIGAVLLHQDLAFDEYFPVLAMLILPCFLFGDPLLGQERLSPVWLVILRALAEMEKRYAFGRLPAVM